MSKTTVSVTETPAMTALLNARVDAVAARVVSTLARACGSLKPRPARRACMEARHPRVLADMGLRPGDLEHGLRDSFWRLPE